MKVKTRLLQTCLSLLSLVSLAFLSPAFAATPVAVWDNNFDDLTNGGWTLDLNGNTANQVTDGTTTVTNSLTITETGGGVTFTPSASFNTISVIIRCSGLSVDSASNQALFSLKKSDTNNRIGSYLKGSDHTLSGMWNDGLYDDTTGPALSTSPSTLGYSYYAPSKTEVYSITTGEATKTYSSSGLRAGSDTYTGLAIGGVSGSTSAKFVSASGLKITAVAIFTEQLDQAAVEAYHFPSEFKDFTAKSAISGDVSWDKIAFNEGDWTSADTSSSTLTLSGDAIITLPAGFVAKSITFSGDYNVTLKEASSATTLSSITTLSGGKSISRVIPGDCTSAITVPSGLTYIVDSDVTLSGANTVAAGGTLKVTNGTATVTFAGTGVKGTVEIAKGATLTATNNDALDYNSSTFKVNVYGTLNLSSYRWTFKGGSLHLYDNAKVTGTGETSNGAIDVWNTVYAHKNTTTEDTEAAAQTMTISAPVRYTGNSGAQPTFDVEENVTLEFTTAGLANNCTKLVKTGAGTLKLSANQPLTGVSEVQEGTLELACDSALSGTTTVSADATLKVSAGTHDLTSHTNNGTVEVAGGTVTVSSSIGGTVKWTDGVLKVKLTATETANGLTLGTNFTLKEDANVIFIESDGTEKEGTNGTYTSDPITWTGKGDANSWSDSDNWSREITSTAVVKLDCENVEITVASTDTMPSALVVSENATLSGEMTFASCAVTEGATLTIDGTATVTALSDAGTLVLNEGTTIAPPTESGGTLGTLFANWTGVVKGKGALKYTSLPGDSGVLGKLQDSTKWQATIAFEGLSGLGDVDLNQYGNASSTISLTGCTMHFLKSSVTANTFHPTLELHNGTYGYGLKADNGYSTDVIQFSKLTGDGTFVMVKPGGVAERRFFLPDVSEFTGCVWLNTASGNSTFYIGKGRDGYTNTTAHGGKIVVACAIPAAMSITNSVGNIVFQDGATLTVADATADAQITGKSCEMDSGATVTLKTSLTDLTDVTSLPFVAWTTKPTSDLAFTIDETTLPAKRWRLSQKSTGLYVVRKYGTMILVK